MPTYTASPCVKGVTAESHLYIMAAETKAAINCSAPRTGGSVLVIGHECLRQKSALSPAGTKFGIGMRIIAKLDVKPPYVVKPVHFEGLRRIGKPPELAKRYCDQGADEIVYIDIVASLYRRDIIPELIMATAQELFVPFAVGGGVRSIEDMSRLFHAGADKVLVNTHVLQKEPDLIDRAARTFGSQSVLVSVEAKRWDGWWECYSDCGRERSGKDVLQWVKEVQERGAGEIVVQSVDCDGRRRGFDIELIQRVKDSLSIPVVAASGAGTVQHVVELAEAASPDAIAVSSGLHYGHFTIGDVKEALRRHGLRCA